METRIQIMGNYLYLPVSAECDEQLLTFWLELPDGNEEKIWELYVPVNMEQQEQYICDYSARFPVIQFTDKTLIMRGNYPEAFGGAVRTGDFLTPVPSGRPSIHFTAGNGWINDPNGLVFHNGMYHLYFQYNPCSTKWNNMSWGHAVSNDLLHWIEKDPVLFPDEHGMMFSGCGLVNTRGLLGLPNEALLFYYTAAGDSMPWSKGKAFTQRLAYSLDGGMTLNKIKEPYLDTICHENRDPKIFWHDKTDAYIMVLWLQENEFGILRSSDLAQWKLTDRFSLEDAWECPDLVCVPHKEWTDSAKWVFLSADGFYYWGEFDGYTFRTDGKKHTAYLNKVPYAAQTVSQTGERIIMIPWLRVDFPGRLYTGAMGVPRELTYQWTEEGPVLSLDWTTELEEQKVLSKKDGLFQIAKEMKEPECLIPIEQGRAILVKMKLSSADSGVAGVEWTINEQKISYDSQTGIFRFDIQEYQIGRNRSEFSFLIDDTIFEVTSENGIITGVFELPDTGTGLLLRPDDLESCRIFDIENKMEV